MTKNDIVIYYEKCDKITMPSYLFFIDKLKQIQKITDKIYPKKIDTYNEALQSIILTNNKCQECHECQITKFYKLGNIMWSNRVRHKIESHQSYPSEYFIKVIINICIIEDTIVNPPIELDSNKNNLNNIFNYIPLQYNKLLIIDALLHQGSYPRYSAIKNEPIYKEKFIYSEHSGVISVKNNIIDNIIVSTETNRVDVNDDNIYLPINTETLSNYEFFFHTHPNTSTYGGRIKEGIIYEFPSANDLFNFIKYRTEGIVQASVIVAPEGIYVIRPITFQRSHPINSDIFHNLRKFIIKLEKNALKKLNPIISKISDPDTFHQKVGFNLDYIGMYNKFIESMNLFIEFYPREKKNNEWCLRQISLPYIEHK